MGALDRIPFSAQNTMHENNSPKHLLPLLPKAGSITQRISPILAPQKYSQACLTGTEQAMWQEKQQQVLTANLGFDLVSQVIITKESHINGDTAHSWFLSQLLLY